MKQLLKTTSILIVFTIQLSCAGKTARVSFTGEAPKIYQDHKQPLTMYACNDTTISHSIEWGKNNPKTIPFGPQNKGDEIFFISKYYIASPPLPNQFVADAPLILGVLSEDHFTLNNANQKVDIFMDYQLLKAIQLGFIPVNYASNEAMMSGEANLSYCMKEQINKIPINIRCPEFNYTEYGKKTTGKANGLGKGIAQLARVKNKVGGLTTKGQLFIPLDVQTKEVLKECTVEILNDIILEHQIYFGTAEKYHEKIDLTQAYQTYKYSGEPVSLYCKARPNNEPAEGCNPVVLQRDE